MKIRKEDTVMIVSGDDKGKSGKVLKVFPQEEKILIEGINFIKRHTRPTQKNPKGGILEKEAPLHIAKVMLFCSKCNSATKVGFKIIEAGGTEKKSKVRVCHKCGEVL